MYLYFCDKDFCVQLLRQKIKKYFQKASLPMDGAFQAKSRYGRSMEVVSYAMGAVITCWSYVQLQNALEIGVGVCGF